MPASISAVVAALDEAENLASLLPELAAELRGLGRDHEIIVVDDGSTDGTSELLRSLEGEIPELRAFRQPTNLGKSAAWNLGFREARCDLVLTIDGDLQNDPADIPRLLGKLEEDGWDLVTGWRRRRRAGFLLKRVPSRLANLLIRGVAGSRVHDHGCGLKLVRRAAIEGITLEEGMHRFLCVLLARRGRRIAEVEVSDRPRGHGRSKYGLERFFAVIVALARLRLHLPPGSWSPRPTRGDRSSRAAHSFPRTTSLRGGQ